MDPVLGGIIGTAVVAAITGGVALYQTRVVEKGRVAAAANTTVMEGVKVQMDGWERLDDAKNAEIVRLTGLIEALAADNDRLTRQHKADRIEIEFCRTNHPPIGDPHE